MGTDIHGWLEGRHKFREPTPDGRTHGPWSKLCEIEDSRNYILFDALAGGRSGDNGDVRPFAVARGLPDDYEPVGTKDPDDYDSANDWWIEGGHTHSWWDLRELLTHPGWDHRYVKDGWISRQRYEAWDHVEPPYPYSGMVSGDSVKHATFTQDGIRGPQDWNYINVVWTEVISEHCSLFLKWSDYVLAKYDWNSELRIVFGFDS